MKNDDFQLSGMKVLMVDDSPVNLDVLSGTLSDKGYDISVATDGEMALKFAPLILPDLILLDIMMPGMDGFETCVKLKSDPITKDIPVVFLSAKTDSSDIVKGFKCGGVDYITKPFNETEVLIRVDTQLQLREKGKKLKEAQAQIKRYAEKLEKTNADLQIFASGASHDLKAPLRKIQQLGDRFKDKYEGTSVEEGKNILGKICNIAEQLSLLIDSVLEFSKLENLPKSFERCELKPMVEKVVENLEVQISESGGKVIVGDLPKVAGEPSLLYRLFQNIISNSIKYHREGVAPIVNVSSSYCSETEQWKIEVSDNGIGIDEKYFDRIFKPFERLHGKNEFEGTGIGLATCQKIVDRLNGDITVQSRLGKGTTFCVALPEK